MSEFLDTLNVQNSACLISSLVMMLLFYHKTKPTSELGVFLAGLAFSCSFTSIIKTNADGDFQEDDFTGFYVYLWEMQLLLIPLLVVLLFIDQSMEIFYKLKQKSNLFVAFIILNWMVFTFLVLTNVAWAYLAPGY